jgi:nucleoside-diphosphate-sugar epimerase
MTPGDQIRDFIYIDDVVSALLAIIDVATNLPAWSQFDIGTGEGIALREYVELARLETGSRTELRTTLKYRPSDLTPLVANVNDLFAIGWRPGVSIATGIRQTVAGERMLC